MPNGGYPMHLLTPIQGTDLALQVKGSEVQLLQRRELEVTDPKHRCPIWDSRGALTRDQVGATCTTCPTGAVPSLTAT